jgi:hypothetical protein
MADAPSVAAAPIDATLGVHAANGALRAAAPVARNAATRRRRLES